MGAEKTEIGLKLGFGDWLSLDGLGACGWLGYVRLLDKISL